MAVSGQNYRNNLLAKLFNVGLSGDNQSLLATKIVQDKRTGKFFSVEDVFSDKMSNLWRLWQEGCHDLPSDYANREQLYTDMETLYMNCPFISRAVLLMAAECIQADVNMNSIGVEAPKDQKEYILKKIQDLGIEKMIFETAKNIILYGDAGWLLKFNDKGVSRILPINIYQLQDRIEFTPHLVQEYLRNKNPSFTQMISTNQKLRFLADSMRNGDDYAQFHDSYLFGFQIGDLYTPPWRFVHFRNFSSTSAFAPFGMPYFIHAMGPYRQWDTAMSLQVMMRGAKFPIDEFKVKLPSHMGLAEAVMYAHDFQQQYENMGLRESRKEGVGLGERVFSIVDMYEYNQIVPQIDLDDVKDIEMLENQLVLSTGLPRNLLDPNNGSFGNSGISLIQQFKPFARSVFQIQSILLQGITQLLKIDMIQSERFLAKDIDFVLTMPYPESQTNPELVQSQNELLSLANSIIDALSDKVLGGAPEGGVPLEIVRQVYTQILPYDATRIDSWLEIYKKAREDRDAKQAEAPPEGDMAESRKREKNLFYESLAKQANKQGSVTHLSRLLEDIIYEKKTSRITESMDGRRHLYSSRLPVDFDVQIMEDWRAGELKKLES